jgi:predicted nuclease with TOPRIM domain
MNQTTQIMENQSRILELVAEALKRLDQMVGEQKETNQRLEGTNQRLERVESEISRLTLQTAENSGAIMKLADKLEVVFQHEKRILVLEGIILK